MTKKPRYKISKKTTFKESDGKVYIIDVKSNNLRTLNETASFLWKALAQKKHTQEELVNLLDQNYQAPLKTLKKDCATFIAKYKKLGLLIHS